MFKNEERGIMEKSGFKKNEWENYRSIAKVYGITIPALKKIFREESLLGGNHLSKKARENDIGITETITLRCGKSERILWNIPEIDNILRGREMRRLIGKEAFFFAENFSQIPRTIEYLGGSMLRFLKFLNEKAEIDVHPRWYRNKFGNESTDFADKSVKELQNAVYESNRYLRVASQDEFIILLEQDFAHSFGLTKFYPADDYEKMRLMFLKRFYQFIGEWATDDMITQYHRKPRKKFRMR